MEMVKTMEAAAKSNGARGASDEFDGKITVSEDGLIVRLPVDSDAIIYDSGSTPF